MKKFLTVTLIMVLTILLVACSKDENSDINSTDNNSIVNEIETENIQDLVVDTIGEELPGSKYVRSTAYQAADTIIQFQNDIVTEDATLKGHCSYLYYDGSGKVVSFRYTDGVVTANVQDDEHIAKYVVNANGISTVDYFFYENYMIYDRKEENVKMDTEGNVDLLVANNWQLAMDGTIKSVNSYYNEDGYYSGTYTREGNILKINTYCEATNQNSEFYWYIDDDGNIYCEVYVKM